MDVPGLINGSPFRFEKWLRFEGPVPLVAGKTLLYLLKGRTFSRIPREKKGLVVFLDQPLERGKSPNRLGVFAPGGHSFRGLLRWSAQRQGGAPPGGALTAFDFRLSAFGFQLVEVHGPLLAGSRRFLLLEGACAFAGLEVSDGLLGSTPIGPIRHVSRSPQQSHAPRCGP